MILSLFEFEKDQLCWCQGFYIEGALLEAEGQFSGGYVFQAGRGGICAVVVGMRIERTR